MQNMQKAPLWWAGHHISHHKHADREGGPHSPAVGCGFAWNVQPVPDRIYAEAERGLSTAALVHVER